MDRTIITHTEMTAGMRKLGNRGYDVIRNQFFVEQTIKIKTYGKTTSKKSTVRFDTFEDYYDYLNGEIYKSSCYYQYVFSPEVIEKYNIKRSKISTRAFVKETLSMCAEIFRKKWASQESVEDVSSSISNGEDLCHSVFKYYDWRRDLFVVREKWISRSTLQEFEKKEHIFKYWVDFVAFLEGDLSNADLLLCDGLANLTDFSKINLDGAFITSSIKERFGLLNSNEFLIFPMLKTFDATMSNESIKASAYWEDLSCGDGARPRKIYYVSDLHILHHVQNYDVRTRADVLARIKRIAFELTTGLLPWDVLLIVGDTSCNVYYFEMFVKMLREATRAQIIFVLGNHELWDFENTLFEEIVNTYRGILINEGMFLLQNNIIYSQRDDWKLQELTEEELKTMDKSALRSRLACAPVILFGGLAFSGLNQDFNANHNIYQKAITREIEIEKSREFECLYTKVRDSLFDRTVIVATHMPLKDWSKDVECHEGYVYVSGHTHRNEYFDDGDRRIYADNQVGYYRKHAHIKYFYIDSRYDIFADYSDGIYEISRNDYFDFYRGKNMGMEFNRKFEKLYMLKCNGYYCFIIQSANRKLSILNGGAIKSIGSDSIESCYAQMPKIIESIKNPLDNFTSIQVQISNAIKSIGGSGCIHGAIIDIDFYNHVYVNPNDYKITGYFALNMVEKMVFGSVRGLIESHRPDLLPAYDRYLTGDSPTALMLLQDADSEIVAKPYYSTDIYKNSNALKKMQRLYSNILTTWLPDERSLTESSDRRPKMLKK